jgi:cell division protein FtsI/penicillin-binding protein 2
MSGRRIVAVLVAAVLLVVAGAAGVLAVRRQRHQQALRDERAAVTRFVQAWPAGRLAQVGFEPAQDVSGSSVADRIQQITAGLTAAATDSPTRVRLLGMDETRSGQAATGRIEVSWTLPGKTEWSYRNDVPVIRRGTTWLVGWSPRLVHPGLADGRLLKATRTLPERADILAPDGTALVTERPVVDVGIDPGRVKDQAATVAAVVKVLDVDGAGLASRLKTAKAGSFLEVITLRQPAYQSLADRLRPIPGVLFRFGRMPLAESATFARALLGSVGEATKEVIDASGGRLQVGDRAGTSGLQARYDAQLAGAAGITVEQRLPGSDAVLPPLLDRPAQPGKPLTLTLDPGIQRAAEEALLAATHPAALVAVRPSTGDVLAVANGGPGATGYDRALLGQYPPGSTFKIASSLALLGVGLTPDSSLTCPPTVTVSGKTFRNAEGEVLGTVPFHSAFAHSCNTAFVGSAKRVDAPALTDAAAGLGVGRDDPLGLDSLGVGAFGGAVPVDDDPVQHAAQMIGQGKVLVSPLAVARMSATVAAGRLQPARLVATDGARPSAGPALPAATVAALRSMMREVVTGGTGTALKSVPGAPVSGKTGTAEFGGGNPPPTHAWFTGFRGDLAFAVVVEDGGFGGKVAAPIAADFLGLIPAP